MLVAFVAVLCLEAPPAAVPLPAEAVPVAGPVSPRLATELCKLPKSFSPYWLLLSHMAVMLLLLLGAFLRRPWHAWSGPKRCFKHVSTEQSLQRTVLEDLRASLHPFTGHFFFCSALQRNQRNRETHEIGSH